MINNIASLQELEEYWSIDDVMDALECHSSLEEAKSRASSDS